MTVPYSPIDRSGAQICARMFPATWAGQRAQRGQLREFLLGGMDLLDDRLERE